MALLAATPTFTLPVEVWCKKVSQQTRTALVKRGAVRIQRQRQCTTSLPVQMFAILAATERPTRRNKLR